MITNLKRHIAFLLTGAALLLGMAGCSDLDSIFDFDKPEEGINGNLTVNFSVQGMGDITRGSTAASEFETRLHHVHLIFFSTADDSHLAHVQSQVIEKNGKRQFSFAIPKAIVPDTEFKVLAVGNADNFIPTADDGTVFATYSEYLDWFCQGRSYSEVRNGLKFSYQSSMCCEGMQNLPMYGELRDGAQEEVKFKYTINGDEYVITSYFYFKRAVVLIDLKSLTDKINIDYVKVVNAASDGYAFRDGATGVPVNANVTGEKPSHGVDGWINLNSANTSTGGNGTSGTEGQYTVLQNSLYAFPNNVSTTGTNDFRTTALMIAARYGNENKLTYYRFNLAHAGDPLSMLRNHIITVVIKGCKGRGDDDEEDAYNRQDQLLSAEVDEEWGAGSDIVTDTQGNFLMLSKTTTSIEGRVKNDKGEMLEGYKEIIQVRVNEGTTWDLRIKNQTGHSNDKFHFERIDDESFSVEAIENNTTYTLRLGYLDIIATTPQGTELEAPFIVQQVPEEEDPYELKVDHVRFEKEMEKNGGNLKTMSASGGRIEMLVETGSSVQGWTVTEVKYVSEEEGYVEVSAAEGKDVSLTPLVNNFCTFDDCTYSSNGGHLGHIIIDLAPNTFRQDRETWLRVDRVFPESATEDERKSVKPYYIHIKQAHLEVLLSLHPEPENRMLVLQGFDPAHETGTNHLDIANGISAQHEMFVSLADPDHYEYEVTSTFDCGRDLLLTALERAPRDTQAWHTGEGGTVTRLQQDKTGNDPRPNCSLTNDKLTGLLTGQKFYINTFNMGPGDPDIYGQITVRAVPKAGLDANLYGEYATSFTVKIENNCTLDDVFVPYGNNFLLVADRNCGALPRIDDKGAFQPALNYTDQPYHHITGYGNGDLQATDHTNGKKMYAGIVYQYSSKVNTEGHRVRGYYYSNSVTAPTATDYGGTVYPNSTLLAGTDVTDYGAVSEQWITNNHNNDDFKKWSSFYTSQELSWRVPTYTEWDSYIKPHIRWSKGRAYILSTENDMRNGKDRYVGCFLPIASSEENGCESKTIYLSSSIYSTAWDPGWGNNSSYTGISIYRPYHRWDNPKYYKVTNHTGACATVNTNNYSPNACNHGEITNYTGTYRKKVNDYWHEWNASVSFTDWTYFRPVRTVTPEEMEAYRSAFLRGNTQSGWQPSEPKYDKDGNLIPSV